MAKTAKFTQQPSRPWEETASLAPVHRDVRWARHKMRSGKLAKRMGFRNGDDAR